MTHKIDWEEPYGEIHGTIEDMPEARWMQGKNFYRVNGELISNSLSNDNTWIK